MLETIWESRWPPDLHENKMKKFICCIYMTYRFDRLSKLRKFLDVSLTSEQQYDPYFFLRKEVIQPQVLLRLPCYDFTPVISPTFGGSLRKGWVTDFGYYLLPWCDGRCVQDPGTYSPRRADPRLLAIPTSCSRVTDYNPN